MARSASSNLTPLRFSGGSFGFRFFNVGLFRTASFSAEALFLLPLFHQSIIGSCQSDHSNRLAVG
jgi:hypothetical protein